MNSGKKEDFKLFVRANPFLIKIISNGKKTWQDLYEFYDLYGDDEEAWNTLIDGINNGDESKNNGLNNHFEDFIKMAKNVDIDKVQEGITSLQKTISLFGDLFVNKKNNNTANYNPRPLYRRFED